jgi:hypothetical protein
MMMMNEMMMRHYYYQQALVLTILMMLGDVPCGDAFKRRRHSALIPISNLHSPHHSPHRINFLSFRGGGNKDEENELVVDDNDDAVYLDFIASFESELADIRRDVEMETENEMNKLLGLFTSVEPRGEVEDKNEMKSEYYDNVAVDDVDENSDSSTNDVSLEESLNVLPSSFISESYYESDNKSDDDALPEKDETIISQLTMNNDSKDEPYNEDITDNTTEPVGLSNDVGEYTQIVDVTTSAGSKVSERTKPKTSKRKTKASKKGKTKIKSRQYYDDVIIELSDDLEELQSQSGGIRGFLQSDLGRVLKLFIPTMILAIITTRMQRQMDEADKLAAVEAIAVASEMD